MAEDQDETPRVFLTGQPKLIAGGLPFVDELNRLYQGGSRDPAFEEVRRRFRLESDAQLADLIETDGRLRLRLRKPLTLRRYLDAVRDLPTRPEPLDAAIDMSLRALAGSSRVDETSVEKLVAEYPQYEAAIREAAVLNNALWSTTRVREHLSTTAARDLPCDFGPTMENGAPRYELTELLGEGAFGQVYLAIDRQLSEEDHPALVSIKVLPGSGRSAWTRQQLVDEATKARRIDHPNVARVLDRGVSAEDEDFIVYEFVDGGDLGRWVRRRKNSLAPRAAVQLVARIARGVHAAHMAGLVHCDLKPNNIVLTTESEPKVTDFGIAIRAEERGRSRPEEDGEAEPLGNLAFMSPEQFRMEPGALTIPTDIYALGGMLYWLVSGVLPNGSTPEAIQRTHDPGHGRKKPPPLHPHNREVDRDLESICQRALAAAPADRHDSAAAFADDLEAWLRHEPVAWTRPSLLRRTGLWARRKPALAASLALILVLLIVGGLVVNHFASVANRRQLEVAVAQARIEEEERLRHEFRQRLHDLVAGFEQADREGLPTQLLSIIWLAEWLYEPTALGTGPERFDLWHERITAVRHKLENARAAGGEDTLQTLVWESALGFWLIEEDCREAETILRENRRKWAAILHPQDPWLAHVEAMRACATVQRLVQSTQAGGLSDPETNDLAGLAAIFDRVQRMLAPGESGSALRRVILRHQRLLYGPDLLDQPERMQEAADHLRLIEEFSSPAGAVDAAAPPLAEDGNRRSKGTRPG
ncbi:MAG: serine/threonine-protein kinase [Planctomycetota bacterium]|nr:serine/threonine-protein kinase [Planctomycetota bacterium]